MFRKEWLYSKHNEHMTDKSEKRKASERRLYIGRRAGIRTLIMLSSLMNKQAFKLKLFIVKILKKIIKEKFNDLNSDTLDKG